MDDTPNKQGRPSIYTEELAKTICLRLSRGESLRRICQEEEMPNADTIYSWVLENKGADAEGRNGFSEKYRRARDIQAEVMVEEMIAIADDSSRDTMFVTRGETELPMEDKEWTNRSKLRVETRKWYISKVIPKKYGDKVDVTSGGETIKGNTIVLKDFNGTPADSK